MISEYKIVKEGKNVNVYFKHDEKELYSTLTPEMTVKRAYLHGEGTLGKFRWAQERKNAKYEIEVLPESELALAWVASMEALREDVLGVLWTTGFHEAKEYFPDAVTMPLSMRKKATAMIHPRYGTLKARRGLWGEVPIMDMALKQVNKFDNETEHVKEGDVVRLQISMKPYCMNEKTYGVSLQLDGVTVVSRKALGGELSYSGTLDYSTCCP